MRWSWLPLLLALPLAAQSTTTAQGQDQAEQERQRKLTEFVQRHQLDQSQLFQDLQSRGYLQWAEPKDGSPASLSFWVKMDGKPAHLVYVPAQGGRPPVAEGMYLVPDSPPNALPRRLQTDPSDGPFDNALGGAVRRARSAAPAAGNDSADLARFARDHHVDPKLRDAISDSFDGRLRRADLQFQIDTRQAEMAQQQAVARDQWQRTPQVASQVASSLSAVVPPPIAASEIAHAAGLDRPVRLPPAPQGGRAAVVLLVSGEADGARAQAALSGHKAAVERTMLEDLRHHPLQGAEDLLAAGRRSPRAAAAVIDASPGLAGGAQQANDGLASMPWVGAGVGLARQGGQADRAERVWDTWLRGRIARRKVDQGTDLGQAQAEFQHQRGNIVEYAGNLAALQVLIGQSRMRRSFAAAGIASPTLLATGDPAEAQRVQATLGGRGAFLQYRTATGGSYYLPLTPAPALAGRAGFADAAARADTRISALARAGTLTPGAARAAWAEAFVRTWGVRRTEADRLAAEVGGGG